MSALACLADLRQRGAALRLDGGDLIVTGADLLSDDEIERLRSMKGELVAALRAEVGWTADDWRAFYDERAAIAECARGMPRAEAERAAFEHCVVRWLNDHAPPSPPNRCAHCGGADRSDDVLIPLGVESAGHSWLHTACWPAWYENRRAEAVVGLRELLGVSGSCQAA